MKFTVSYEQTSQNSFYRPYFYIDNKRVSREHFEFEEIRCQMLGKIYNCPSLKRRGKRYISSYYLNDYKIY